MQQAVVHAVEAFLAQRETAEVRADPDALRALAEAREAVRSGDIEYGTDAARALSCATSIVTEPYRLGTAPPARRAIADRLPRDAAVAAVELITGPLLANPYRVGKPLAEELEGILSARLARDWRVLYEIDSPSAWSSFWTSATAQPRTAPADGSSGARS